MKWEGYPIMEASWELEETLLINTSNIITYNASTSNTASTLSLVDQLEELDWYFQDIFDQFGNMYKLFDNINHLVEEYPLIFLLFEIQQLTSFLQRHWNASYQTLPVKIVCLLSTCLLLRDICSPREGWPPNMSCSPPSSKRTSIHCSLSSLPVLFGTNTSWTTGHS